MLVLFLSHSNYFAKIWTKKTDVKEERIKKSNTQSGSQAPKEMNENRTENIRLTFFVLPLLLLLCCYDFFHPFFFVWCEQWTKSFSVSLLLQFHWKAHHRHNQRHQHQFFHLVFFFKPKTIVLTLEYSPWPTRYHTEARQCCTRYCGLFVATTLFAPIFLSFFMPSRSFVRRLHCCGWSCCCFYCCSNCWKTTFTHTKGYPTIQWYKARLIRGWRHLGLMCELRDNRKYTHHTPTTTPNEKRINGVMFYFAYIVQMKNRASLLIEHKHCMCPWNWHLLCVHSERCFCFHHGHCCSFKRSLDCDASFTPLLPLHFIYNLLSSI